MPFEVKVDRGEIIVSEDGIVKVVDDPNAKAWEVDLMSKYAYVVALASMANRQAVILGASDRTLDIDTARRGDSTDFTIEFPEGEDWILLAHCARYTLRIVAYRRPGFVPEG
jgi:hypothetical protein